MPDQLDPWESASVWLDVQRASARSATGWRERSARRLAALIASAVRDSAFYRRAAAGRDPSCLALHDFAPVTKRELMAHYDSWVTDPALSLDALQRFIADPARIGEAYLGRYQVWESSGSTGQPAIFVQDAHALAVYDALEALRRPSLRPLRRWLDPCYACEQTVFVGATGGHFASTASLRRLCRLYPWLGASLHTISFLQPMPDVVAALETARPTILATYPSTAIALAQEALAGRLRLGLQEIWTGGEQLTPAMRRSIAAAFDCPVSQSYGASEFFTLAAECACGRLHLNADWAILEPVDAQHRPVAPGVVGHTTLLTNLANRVQPLIRYDLGDRIRLPPEPCACGSELPVIEVEGRCDDMLVLDGAGHRPLTLSALAVVTVLEEEAGVFDFRIEQTGPRRLQLRMPGHDAGAEDALRRAAHALTGFLRAQGAGDVRLESHCGGPHSLGRSGKHRRVIGLASGRGHAASH